MGKFSKNKKQELTLKDIAELIKTSSEKTEKKLENKIDTSVEWLATVTQKQFLEIKGEFSKTHKQLDGIEKEIKGIRRDFEDLKLRLDQAAYKFEIKEMEKRIRRIETKIGLSAAMV